METNGFLQLVQNSQIIPFFFNIKLLMMGANEVEAHQKHSRCQILNEKWVPLPLKTALLLLAGHT